MTQIARPPMVALLGRPNVGKSTLSNRITRTRKALVDPTPGVTRDRHYSRVTRLGKTFLLVDTGGLEPGEDEITRHIRRQALQAAAEADLICFLMDGRQGLTPGDQEIVDLLRAQRTPVLYVVNKIDAPEQEAELLPVFWELGVERIWPLSAEHGYGYRRFLEALTDAVPPVEEGPDLPQDAVRLALLGRPNVGKSSMVNQLLGDERMVVSSQAGTTRDAVDALLVRGGRRYLLIDTAGIRRKGKTRDKLEKFSVLKALAALDRCQVALVLVDAAEGVTDQDVRIVGYVQEQGRGCLLLLNKWDLIADDRQRQRRLLEEVRLALPFAAHVPVLKVSARTGQGVGRIFPEVGRVERQLRARFSTSRLNRLLQDAVAQHPPPLYRGRRLKFYYTAQIGVAPPTFAVIANAPRGIHFSYERYLRNRFREGLGLDRVPIRLLFRERRRRR